MGNEQCTCQCPEDTLRHEKGCKCQCEECVDWEQEECRLKQVELLAALKSKEEAKAVTPGIKKSSNSDDEDDEEQGSDRRRDDGLSVQRDVSVAPD